jgi:glycosyltransferase involved in cell wall biosynthesis
VNFEKEIEDNGQSFPCNGCAENGFFYLPNQWWLHKNHKWALESFMEYQHSGGRAHLILTGVESDYRWPNYSADSIFSDLKIKNAHRLGFVTRSLQRKLYLNAIATIQPSSYEGWSTTIEEALALGSPIIASNISSNVEQLIDCKDAQLIESNSVTDLVTAFHSPPKKIKDVELITSRHSWRWQRFLDDLEGIVVRGDYLTSLRNK